MGLLDLVNITFTSSAETPTRASGEMVLGVCLQDTKNAVGTYTIKSARAVDSVLKNLSNTNKDAVKLAMLGANNKAVTTHVYVVEKSGSTVHWDTEADLFGVLDTCTDDWLVFPGVTDEDAAAIATWLKESNKTSNYRKSVVLPNTAANDMHVVNFCASGIVSNDTDYSATQYAPRIAGYIAALGPSKSCMYAKLPDVTAVDTLSKKELDEKAAAGELHLFNDGQAVRIASGRNSLTSSTDSDADLYKHIKEVQVLDMIHNNLKAAILNSFIGRYTNSYNNRLLLVSEIKTYLESLEAQGLLESGYSTAELDIEAQTEYLRSNGYTIDGRNVDNMTDDEILRGNCRNKVFVKCAVMVLGAIESVDITVEV